MFPVCEVYCPLNNCLRNTTMCVGNCVIFSSVQRYPHSHAVGVTTALRTRGAVAYSPAQLVPACSPAWPCSPACSPARPCSPAGRLYTLAGRPCQLTVHPRRPALFPGPADLRPGSKMGLTAAGRPPSSATGRAVEDGDEVADEMGEEEDKELRWTPGIC